MSAGVALQPGGASQRPASVVHLAWARYKQQLKEKPLQTKAVTAACIAGLSDVLAQRISSGRYDWRKTVKMALFGLVWGGPSAHYWQDLLQRLFAGKNDPTTAVQKVVVDQLTYGPVCNILFMLYTSLALGGLTAGQAVARVVRDYPSVQLQGWRLWPAAGLLNYRFVPLEYRVMFINLVALCWSTFLNVRARSSGKA